MEYYKITESVSKDDDRYARLLEKANRSKQRISALESELSESEQIKQSRTDEVLKDTLEVLDAYGESQDKEEFEYYKRDLAKSSELFSERITNTIIKQIESLKFKVLFRQYETWQDYFYYLSNPKQQYAQIKEANYWMQRGYTADETHDFEAMKDAVRHLIKLVDKTTYDIMKERMLPPDLRML